MESERLDGELCPCCGKAARSRGVCHPTYTAAKRMIMRGETTWEQLERAGKVKPTTRYKSRLTKSVKYLLGVDGGNFDGQDKSNHSDIEP